MQTGNPTCRWRTRWLFYKNGWEVELEWNNPNQNEAWTTLSASWPSSPCFTTQPCSLSFSCMNVSCLFNLPVSNKAPFHRTPTLIPPKTNLRPISRIAECILFLRSWYKLCDFFEYNWKKQQEIHHGRKYFFPIVKRSVGTKKAEGFFCSDLKLKDHCKKWFIVMHDIKFQLVPRAFSLKVGKALVTRLYQIVSRICK